MGRVGRGREREGGGGGLEREGERERGERERGGRERESRLFIYFSYDSKYCHNLNFKPASGPLK